MNKGAGLTIGVIALAVAAGGGYWLGGKGSASHGESATPAAATSTEPAKKEKKLLFYRNPMGLPDTSPTPKKDPMGMDYIAVYEGETDDEPTTANQIKISTEKVQKLGVRTEAAQLRILDKVVRASGRIEPDERRMYAISPKFEGYVERLHVNVTGQPVGKGQPLFEVYSPELVSAQREYAIAAQGVESLKEAGGPARDGMKQLADSSLLRLKNWDISEEQVKALAKSGEAKRTMTFRSPVAGIVTEKKAVQGMRFMPGEALYQVADLSSVWVVADVFEQDIGLVKSGSKAKVTINAYPGKTFDGTISLCLSDLERPDPYRAGSRRTGQSGAAAQAVDVRPGRTAGGRQRPGGHGADLRRHRQRCPPDRTDPARRRPLRAARGQTRGAQRQSRRSAGGGQGRRTGGGRRQLPDRCREQPQGGGRRFRPCRPRSSPQRRASGSTRTASRQRR
jgi:hypothetical protein